MAIALESNVVVRYVFETLLKDLSIINEECAYSSTQAIDQSLLLESTDHMITMLEDTAKMFLHQVTHEGLPGYMNSIKDELNVPATNFIEYVQDLLLKIKAATELLSAHVGVEINISDI